VQYSATTSFVPSSAPSLKDAAVTKGEAAWNDIGGAGTVQVVRVPQITATVITGSMVLRMPTLERDYSTGKL
jgi:hypothetical protein|tara:strand:+ start:79 stop:294 length:216 start_codon:yes stop_codon:yes gene_type:complete